MSYLFISSLIRYKSYGWIYKVNLNDLEIEEKVKVYSNSKVAKHGGPHGLAIWGNHLVTGTYSDIRIYDKNLKEFKRFSHPFLSGIHGITVFNDQLWVSSCNNDGVFCFNKKGKLLKQYFLLENKKLMSYVDKKPTLIDRYKDFRHLNVPFKKQLFHVNEVQKTNKALIVSLNKHGLIWDLEKNKVLVNINSNSIHDGKKEKKGYVAIDTQNEILKFFDLTGKLEYHINVQFLKNYKFKDWVNLIPSFVVNKIKMIFSKCFSNSVISDYKVNMNWVRGYERINENTVVVGTSPSSIIFINTNTKKVTNVLPLSYDLLQAVFAILKV